MLASLSAPFLASVSELIQPAWMESSAQFQPWVARRLALAAKLLQAKSVVRVEGQQQALPSPLRAEREELRAVMALRSVSIAVWIAAVESALVLEIRLV